jgi:hypothetical protein
MVNVNKIAQAFVVEYLQREPEFIDFMEFADEEFGYVKERKMTEAYGIAVGLLGDEAQRFADRNN